MEIKFTSELLVLIAAAFLSLLFSYVPWVARWYYKNSPDIQRLIMLGALVIVTVGAFLLGCYGFLKMDLPCTQNGVITLIGYFIMALMSNQSVDRISPKVGAKKELTRASFMG